MKDSLKTIEQLIEENVRLKKELDAFKLMHKNCENRLKRSSQVENALNNIIESNPLSTQLLDKNGKSKHVNAAFIKLFKFKPLRNYCVFTDIQLAKQGMMNCFEQLKQGMVVYFPDHYYNLSKNNPNLPNERLWLRVIGFPIFFKNNMPERFVIIHQNITDEKMAVEKTAQINKKLKGLNKYIEEVKEREQKKLSRKVHDQIGMNIVSIKMKADRLKRIDDLMEKNQLIDDIIALTISTNENIVSITKDLRNFVLEDMGISAAIQNCADDFTKLHNIKTICTIAPNINLDYDTSLVIHRVMQQALHNILLHAEAERVDIQLQQNSTSVEFTIIDDGKGIAKQKVSAANSFGIMIMRERVEELGGKFKLKGSKNIGTTLVVNLPLKTQKS